MTFRIKVNQPSGPRYYYALGTEALDTLLTALYSAGPITLVLTVMR